MKGDIMAIDFVYEDELKLSKDNYEQQFIKIVEAALQYLKIEDDVELSCIIVDDERIHQINKEYRNIDRSTDVISFALEDNDQFYVAGMPRSLGDTVSYTHLREYKIHIGNMIVEIVPFQCLI